MSMILYKKYTNYNFYFLDTPYGCKEIKEINIVEKGKVLFTLNKPWFENTKDIVLECSFDFFNDDKVDLNSANVIFESIPGTKNGKLYIDNSIVGFTYREKVEDNLFYKNNKIYKTDNEMFGCHSELVYGKPNTKRIVDFKGKSVECKRWVSVMK